MKFELHSKESAPGSVKSDLEAVEKTYGAVFNLYRGLAASPAALKAYLGFNELLQEYGRLTPVEQQVVYITVSAENGCTYCVGAHSAIAGMVKMPEQILTALREQRPLADPKLEALRRFSLRVMNHRGWVPEQELADFLAAGFEQAHVLEVLAILAQKTLSNYFNHMAHMPLDQMFAAHEWHPNGAVE